MPRLAPIELPTINVPKTTTNLTRSQIKFAAQDIQKISTESAQAQIRELHPADLDLDSSLILATSKSKQPIKVSDDREYFNNLKTASGKDLPAINTRQSLDNHYLANLIKMPLALSPKKSTITSSYEFSKAVREVNMKQKQRKGSG